MAKISIKNLTKKYKSVTALSDISLEIAEKEFLVIFGPAGAGKTTLLSSIAGILDIDAGTIAFNDSVVNDIEPNKRNVAMVFENYALYPHFTVYDNIAFPLRSPEFKQDENYIKDAVLKITKIMNIDKFLDRYPSQLSNGQRQRIALGRALVRNPNVFLMDEPLAHLDAKLKNLMRTELKEIQNQLDTTTLYVTHDYLEALSLADRIVIINKGMIVQVGVPDDIYYRPHNIFVAKLVGEPEINLFTGRVINNKFIISENSIDLNIPLNKNICNTLSKYSTEIILGIRGADIKVSFTKEQDYLDGEIFEFYSIGNRYVIEISYKNISFKTLLSNDYHPKIGQKIYFKLDQTMLMFFNHENEQFICRVE